jgi:1,2-diacylglycerol 3-alpha-glucosyltransferase
MDKFTVGLFNDSFPPTIDGVANVVSNYARIIQKKYGNVVVATPYYPNVVDDYPFEVVRYKSANVSKRLEYRAGFPLAYSTIEKLKEKRIDIIHTHCPFSSTLLARLLRHYTGAPIVFTYHTRYDIDFEKRIAFNSLRKVLTKVILANINACDEIWTVSEGAKESLKKLGYKGDCIIMENGTDFIKGRSPQEDIDKLSRKYNLKDGIPTFLYVGRMMWYKGIKLTVDALKIAKDQGACFKMIFVGEGMDKKEIVDYVKACNLEDRCVFTGAVNNREELKTYYCIANLFLFPSTYDTNGIVVREAAACYCPSLLIEGSCAAEGITHDYTGILTKENKESISAEILKACSDLKRLEIIGTKAADKIYRSWDDAVERAYKRYEVIINNYTKNEYLKTSSFISF